MDNNVADSNNVESSGETFWRRVFEAQNREGGPKKTDYPLRRDRIHWEYLRHYDLQHHQNHNGHWTGGRVRDSVEILPTKSVRIRQAPNCEGGLSTTRFRRGFQRRGQIHIRQDEPRLEREAHKRQICSAHLKRRRERLRRLDKRNGFNVITGQFDPTNCRCTTPFHVQPTTTREAGSLSEVNKRAEYVLLRDSQFKFHAPAWSGKNHDSRQDLLLREGLNKPKMSSLLGTGTDDLASAGAEDMFSKAIYDPVKTCAVEGLVESSIPGRYTPRKMMARSATTSRSRDSPLACSTTGEWPFSSAAALGTVFRAIPTGLNGHGHALLPRTGATVPGIAPLKPLSGSKSAPVLGRRPPVPDILRSTFARQPHNGRKGGNGGDSYRSPGKGESGHTSGPPSVNEVELAPAATLPERSNGGYHGAGRESRRSRRLSSSRLDHERSASVESGPLRSLPKTSPESVAMLRTGSSSASSKVTTPAQRRAADQLALDLAAVRSLDM